eukprot:2643116-Alexandrium_andersonii.AAC.1
MSASLVGSEMCIRDRSLPSLSNQPLGDPCRHGLLVKRGLGVLGGAPRGRGPGALGGHRIERLSKFQKCPHLLARGRRRRIGAGTRRR